MLLTEKKDFFRLIKCLVWTAMFSRVRGVKALPSVHCDHILQMFLAWLTQKKEID